MNPTELRDVVLRVLGEIVPEASEAELDPDEDLRDQLDLDSMDHLNFVIALNEQTGVDIPERDYPKLVTLSGCVEYLSERLQTVG